MTTADTPLEQELHAYVDGRLDDTQRARIEDWLAEHPDAAARVRDWRRQNELLHQAFDPLLEEPIPDRLQTRTAAGTTGRRWQVGLAAGWMAVGGFVGFLAGSDGRWGASDPAVVAVSTLPQHAAIAHAVYSPEIRHPVEVGADQEAHLVQWLSKRLAQPIKIPGLSEHGFALVGGRLLPGDGGPVAQFMYENRETGRLTLYLSKPSAGDRETAFRYADEDGISVFYWIDARFAYALAGTLPRETLLAIAESAYRQLEQNGAAL